jgi:hypothetical protein
MKDFIHRENLALFRRKLAETNDDATRHTLLKLLAEEEANDPFRPGKAAGVKSDPKRPERD